jgi:predicted regulator of Ras-like GTPase activity (Roadblock/LC7/MglB family)
MKVKMLGYVKKILRKWVETPEEGQAMRETGAPPAASSRRIVMAPRSGAEPGPGNGSAHNGRGVEVPLQPIVSSLPLELQPQVRNTDAGGLTISIPLEKILGQLSRGTVRISFGELRQAAPDLFSSEGTRDNVLVPLPLGEILPRLNPALITRRRVQKHVEVPEDIRSPFDSTSQSLVFSVGPSKPEAAPAPAAPVRQMAPPAPMPVVPPPRSNLTFAPTPPPPTAAPVPTNAPTFSAAPRPLPDTGARRPQAPTPPAIPMAPVAPLPAPAATPAAPLADASPLLINLTSLAESWPEPLRQELVQLNLVDAKVALPSELIERALKQGRVAFTWKTLRSWIKPLPSSAASTHDGTVLELPLKIVAPPFLARQKAAAALHKKVEVDAEIPNLFFGFPKPDPSAGMAPGSVTGAKPADTNFYVWDDASDRARIQDDEVKRGPSPGTKFVAKYATPNEVVSRASALDGVAGALIALPDGLMVASKVSSDLNGETLAAFLPQIFGKVNQCTKELRMGELNNVNFTVGNIPWKIFRVNAIFFAAFGRVGEPLPTAQLAALAGELDHRPK